MRLRKYEADKVASIAVFNRKGRLLLGKRNDNGRWTLPGGHFEPGERPVIAALRELQEEAGFDLDESDIEFLGEGLAGRNNSKTIYAFRAVVEGQPDSSEDPDEECDEWKWVDVSNGLPKEIAENLHSPKNVTLRLLGLQEGESMKKSLRDQFLAVAASAALASGSAGAAAVQDQLQDSTTYRTPIAAEWTPNGLDEDLRPIVQLESSGGQRMEHMPHSKGEFHTAFGAAGMKPITAFEEYQRTKWLQKLYPDLGDETDFLEAFKTNPVFYNSVASAHWRRLKRIAGGDASLAAYAWRWGAGMMARTDPVVAAADPYVQAFVKLHAQRMPQVSLKHSFETAVGSWLQKSTKYFCSKDGIRIPHSSNPERVEYEQDFFKQADEIFGRGQGRILRLVKVETSQLQGCNLPVNNDRLRLYERMLKAGDKLPPVVVQRAGDSYSLLDGNHRHQASQNVNHALMDALEVVEPAKSARKGKLKLYDMSHDELGLMQAGIRQTEHGQFYEPADIGSAVAQLKKLGYHGYRGAHRDPSAVTYFTDDGKA